VYYFAYGSNLDTTQMQRRCPGSRPLGPAVLRGYDFRFDGVSQNWSHAAAANVVPSPTSTVWGALYEMSAENLAELDRFEPNYERSTVDVVSKKLGHVSAVTYLRAPRERGRPSPEYLATILRGAKENDLPEEYLSNVVAIAGLK
jgi:gamma-glutamylcyclotransferase